MAWYMVLKECVQFMSQMLLWYIIFLFNSHYFLEDRRNRSSRGFFEEPLIKIPHTFVSSGGYQRRLGGGGFCGCFPLGALIIPNRTSAMLNDKRINQKTSAKPSICQPPLVTSTKNGCMGYFSLWFLKNIFQRVFSVQ